MQTPEKKEQNPLLEKITEFVKEHTPWNGNDIPTHALFFQLPEIQKQMKLLKNPEDEETFFSEMIKTLEEAFELNNLEKPDQNFLEILKSEFLIQLQSVLSQKINFNDPSFFFKRKIKEIVR